MEFTFDPTFLSGLDYLVYRLWHLLLLAFVLGAFWGWYSCPGREIE